MSNDAVSHLISKQRQVTYERLVDELAYRYGDAFTHAEIAEVVEQSRSAMAATSKIEKFLPLLTARFARETLEAKAVAEGRVAKQKPELLFVCVHNAGRSQIAAALARHLSNDRVNVRSAGSDPTDEVNPVVAEVLAERNVPLIEAYPKPLTDSVVRAADVIVTMGCGDECPYYPGKRYLDWAVPDPAGADTDRVREIVADVEARITSLLHDIIDKGVVKS
ncbi:low molecular weight phosphatase family protein [Granulicoccus sp. GXG6511]|uniref:arsenate-mycothiol transferase ArsC n=1 Tax=Granulicoccus sp. GXG6511 TaxID=3381351 RepID=UPI003D7ED698